jgi:phytoene/squalene synthetase
MNLQKEKILEIFESIDFLSIRDHPNILVAARFWEHERYCAAKIFYKFMRKIDDMIDDYKASHKTIAEPEKFELVSKVNEWIRMTIRSEECNPFQKQMIFFRSTG